MTYRRWLMVVCTCLALVGIRSGGGEGDEELKARAGAITHDGEVKDTDPNSRIADKITDLDRTVEVLENFEPPTGGWTFKKFESENTYFDVLGSTHGVITRERANPPCTSTDIGLIWVDDKKPTNAGIFEKTCEGKLKPPPRKGKGGKSQEFYWVANVETKWGLAIDSNNSGSVDSTDDKIEDDEALPGRFVVANDVDIDGDAIPDFADGFDFRDDTEEDDIIKGSEQPGEHRFCKLFISVPPQPGKARLSFSYDTIDDLSHDLEEDYVEPYSHGSNAIRIWLKDSTEKRIAKPTNEDGDLIVPTVDLPLDRLAIENGMRVVFVEGISPGQTRVALEVEDGTGYVEQDAVRLSVVRSTMTAITLNGNTLGESDEEVEITEEAPDMPAVPVIAFTDVKASIQTDQSVRVEIRATVMDQLSEFVRSDGDGVVHVKIEIGAGEQDLRTVLVPVNYGPGDKWRTRTLAYSFTKAVTVQPDWDCRTIRFFNVLASATNGSQTGTTRWAIPVFWNRIGGADGAVSAVKSAQEQQEYIVQRKNGDYYFGAELLTPKVASSTLFQDYVQPIKVRYAIEGRQFPNEPGPVPLTVQDNEFETRILEE